MLRLLCPDVISSAQEIIYVLSLHLLPLCREDAYFQGRTSLCLSFRNSICTARVLAVHAAYEHEEECDGSIHSRHHTLLPLYGEALSSPPHDVLLSATGKREYRSSGVSALVVDAGEEEDCFFELVHLPPEGVAP